MKKALAAEARRVVKMGPGGPACPCCRTHGKETKKAIRRAARRAANAELRLGKEDR